MSDTPRTDAAETRANASTNPYSVLREHARDLERKLAEAMDRSQEDWVALTQRAERAEAALQSPDYTHFAELLRPPFKHARSCPSLTPGNDTDCTCGLQWRIELSTVMTLLTAWQKRTTEAESRLAALQVQPDVAGLVDAYDAARYRFEEWDGDVLIPEQNADLEWRVTEKNAARQRILDALLSLSAQLQEKEAECEGLRQDAELLGHLMNLVPVSPKAITHEQGWLILDACQEIANDRAAKDAARKL